MSLVDQALVPELFEHPPYRLHIVAVHRAVPILKIDPAPNALDKLSPLGSIAQNNTPTGLIVFRNPVLFNLAFAIQAQFLAKLVFYGQAVTVPSKDAIYVFAIHSLIARDHIFNRPCQQVSVMRQTRRKRRPIVKNVFIVISSDLERFFKRSDLIPKSEHLFFLFGKIHICIYFFKH